MAHPISQSAKLVAVSQETPTIRRFELAPELFEGFPAGSHIDVEVEIDGRRDIRSYSLIGRSAECESYSIAVKLLPESRGGSRYMWELEKGDTIRISRPKSEFELGHGDEEYLLLAGGIGITPIIGMAFELAARNKPFQLVYAARSRDELAFARLLEERLGDRLLLHVDAEDGLLDLETLFERAGQHCAAAVCGPLPMLEAVKTVWSAAGRDPARLRFETFGSSGARPAEAFRVMVVDTGRELLVPANRSLLDVLEESGIGVVSDCRRGECGVCMVQIVDVDGVVDHRDVFMSSPEHDANRAMCACVSRASGTLRIDSGLRPFETA